jgi:acetyl esterase/lipase
MGSSAGGHLVAILATMRKDEALVTGDPVDDESPFPNLAVLCYPVITMGSLTHLESQHHLLGHEPSPAMCKRLSAEHRVTTQTPPCFIWHTVADEAVPVENSLLFAAALRRKRIPFELHLYEQGGHGLGLADGHPWTHACLAWLRRHFSLDRISPSLQGVNGHFCPRRATG